MKSFHSCAEAIIIFFIVIYSTECRELDYRTDRTFEYKCNRACDSKRSGADCWEPNFRLYTADFMLNLYRYFTVVEKIKESDDRKDLLDFLQKSREKEYEDFQDTIYTKKLLESLNEFKELLSEYENETMMETKQEEVDFDLLLSCPINKCNVDDDTAETTKNQVNIYKFIIFIGGSFTMALVIAYAIFYFILETKILKLYRAMESKD